MILWQGDLLLPYGYYGVLHCPMLAGVLTTALLEETVKPRDDDAVAARQ